MIIKKLTITNIRSYEHAEIEFPPGSTLLAGDIGSGKTSVLLAIEFALFGLQPGQKGASLLRAGTKDGGVILELEIDNKIIILERTLKRGKTVSQEEARITIDNETREMSVTELKNIVLSSLQYPPEFAKKSNILYRFTVYTPQEEMKQIITESSDARLDTLRHVFGIDKYKRIKENAEIIRLKLREETKSKEAMILDLESKKSRKIQKSEIIEKLLLELVSIDKELAVKTESRKQIESSIKETQEKMDDKKRLENEIGKTQAILFGKRELVLSLTKEEERLKTQILELEKLMFNEQELASLENSREDIKKQVDTLNQKYMETSGQISSVNMSNLNSERVKQNISKIDLCPTCLQDVNSTHKANIINKFDSEISSNKSRILELDQEKTKASLEIESLKKNIQEKEARISELKLTRVKLEALSEKKTRISEIEAQKSSIEKDFNMLETHIDSLKSSIFNLSKYETIFKAKEKELENARREEQMEEIKSERTKKELELTRQEILELDKEISEKEEIKKKLGYLLSLQDWLTTTFLDIISFTEMNVLLRLREEFSKLFNEWFNILVPEIFTVRLDDSFTPVIEQQDYELDYNFLSGGERTAIALAYRLALNQTINSLLSKIKTKDIVILDEPTDGFSEQQLDKMRDVLSQLKVKQLILVSHESKIESFVENIIKFKKEQGVTRVES
ncbi:MAG: AAA family ATPase [Nanoarchaeota archaeon]|nr:AAA family ATPase [Nanoarchaeota archaeon]